MKERLSSLFKKNKQEIDIIDNTNYLSDGAKEDRKKIVKKENELIENYQNTLEKNTKIIKAIDEGNKTLIKESEKAKLYNEIYDAENELVCEKQGTIKNIISAFLGQVDKKIHNFIFKEAKRNGKETKFRNKLWSFHKNEVENRYIYLKGFIKESAILFGILSLVGFAATKGGLLLSGKILYCASGMLFLDSTIKAISTKYNLNKFGKHPKLNRIKELFSGNYMENIETAKMAHIKSKILNNPNYKIEEPLEDMEILDIKREVPIIDRIKKDEALINQNAIINKPNINDYAKLNRDEINPNNDLTFDQAISIVRNKNLSFDDKMNAYAKLAYVFGKNKKNKNNVEKLTKTLNDFNNTERLLSQYGRMIDERKKELINNGINIENDTLLKQYNNLYLELMYHLGTVNKDDYSFEDFIADEALRYANDLKQYEDEQKIMKKAM